MGYRNGRPFAGGLAMPIENWSDDVVVARLADDPQFTDDMVTLEPMVQKKKPSVVLDLAGVHYVNSSNIARLLRLRKQIVINDRRLLLCSVTPQVWGAMLVTGLDKVFDFTDDLPTALATLQISAH
jgi:anti-anti-sigma factor